MEEKKKKDRTKSGLKKIVGAFALLAPILLPRFLGGKK